MFCKFLEHARHGEEYGQPFMDLPGFVDAHADDENDEIAFEFSGHSRRDDICHSTTSMLKVLLDVCSRCCAVTQLPAGWIMCSGMAVRRGGSLPFRGSGGDQSSFTSGGAAITGYRSSETL